MKIKLLVLALSLSASAVSVFAQTNYADVLRMQEQQAADRRHLARMQQEELSRVRHEAEYNRRLEEYERYRQHMEIQMLYRDWCWPRYGVSNRLQIEEEAIAYNLLGRWRCVTAPAYAPGFAGGYVTFLQDGQIVQETVVNGGIVRSIGRWNYLYPDYWARRAVVLNGFPGPNYVSNYAYALNDARLELWNDDHTGRYILQRVR